jgi:PREDICTED: similar to MGC81089 protein
LEKHLELLKDCKKDCLLSDIEAYKCQLESNFNNLKKATVFCRKSINEEERKKLFSFDGKDSGEEMKKKNAAMKAASLTDDLYRIRRMIADQVSQSEVSLQALVRSSATVTEVSEEFKSMGSALNQSKSLLSKYGRREISDTVLIILAFILFYSSCLYIIWKRIF